MGIINSVQAIKIRRNGELVLLAQYRTFLVEKCPDFAFVRCKITPAIQHRVLANWEAIACGHTPAMRAKGHSSPVVYFYDSFYTRLFEVAPEVRSLFRSSIIVQGKALINIVQSIANGVNSADAIANVVELAYRHNQYGVKMQYYNVLGRVLLEVLRDCTGHELWTNELDVGWRTVYAYMMTTMAPILYHGVTHPTERDKAMAKRGRYRHNMKRKRASDCPVKQLAWREPPS